jgi:branched-chain amino acid transport system substrate-binding protein
VVLKPAGFENATGIIFAAYVRDPAVARRHDTKGYKDFAEFMKKHYPDGDTTT